MNPMQKSSAHLGIGESLGPSSQFIHTQKDPHQPGKPYEWQEYPKHLYHPSLGKDKDGNHNFVVARDAEHEKQIRQDHAERGDNPLPIDGWRENPRHFGKEDKKNVPPEQLAAQTAVALEQAKKESAAKDDLIAQLQAQLALNTAQGKGRQKDELTK